MWSGTLGTATSCGSRSQQRLRTTLAAGLDGSSHDCGTCSSGTSVERVNAPSLSLHTHSIGLFDRLEAVPELRIFPFARFFDWKAPPSASSSRERRVSWFFIALSFHIPRSAVEAAAGGVHNVDLSAVIQEFAFVVDQWELRHGGMDLQVDHVRRRDIPDWVVQSTYGGDADNATPAQSQKKRSGAAVADPACFSDADTPHTLKKPKSKEDPPYERKVSGASAHSLPL